jgi:hypothetical protein
VLAFLSKEENNSFMNENLPESPQIVKYQDFLDNPEGIIDSVNLAGEPAVVTRHGRFMFLVEPLDEPEPSETVSS